MFTSFLRSEEAIGPLQLSDHVVQNGQTGEQMTHWVMLKKATKFEFSLFKARFTRQFFLARYPFEFGPGA